MANLTKADREKLSESDFGDPKRRLYPITDQEDVDSAARLIGKAQDPDAVKKRIIAIAKRKGLSIPDAWKEAKNSAAFALDSAEPAGDLVIRRGKIFEAGDYPDKGFALSPEEMVEAVAEFQPVPNDLEHMDTILNGNLGELRAVSVDDDGWTLNGDVAIPKWLHDLAPTEPLKVSTKWDIAAKRLTGNSLVLNPRVTDAAVMSAYAEFAARHDTPTGQMGVQELHDAAARLGAVCKKSNAQMASQHEASAFQQVHDLMVDNGATCASGKRPSWAMYGADSAGRAEMSEPQDKAPGWLDGFRTWLHGGQQGSPPPAPTSTQQSATAVDDARFTALEKQLTEERAKRFAAEAATFADRIIPRRAMPAERDTIIALHVRAAEDDAKDPQQVTFGVSADKQPLTGGRVQAFEAAYLSRPESLMTRDMVPAVQPDGSFTLSSGAGNQDAEEKERKATAEWYQRTHGNGAAAKGGSK